MTKSGNYILSCIARRFVSIVLVLFLFTSSVQTNNVFITSADAWMTGKSYSLLVSSMPRSKDSVSIMKDILNRNTIRPRKSIITKYYDGEAVVGTGSKRGISQGTWDSWVKKAYAGSRSNDVCYYYYDGHSGKYKQGYLLHKNSAKEIEDKKQNHSFCSYEHLLNTLAKYTKGQVIIILDTCYAGEVINTLNTLISQNKFKDKNRFVIIAGVQAERQERDPLINNPFGHGPHLFMSKFKKGCINNKGKWPVDSNGNHSVGLSEIKNYCKNSLFLLWPKVYPTVNKTIFKYNSSEITLNRTMVILGKNKSVTLKATVKGKKGTVKWSSSNSSVATVSSKGKVTGKKRGTATITASLNGAKATCKVKVTIPVSKITLNKTTASLAKGKTVTLKATVSPSNAVKKTIKWTSSNSNIATVSSKGVVKGIAKGTATITAKSTDGSGKKATCKVTVNVQRLVPNITDTLLKKKPADAAKALGLMQKKKYVDDDIPRYYFLRKGKTRNDKAPVLEYFTRTNLGGYWNIDIKDTSVTFYGIKVGMSRSKVESLMKKTNWKRDSSYTNGLFYVRPLPFKLDVIATYDKAYLCFEFRNGKLILISYFTGSCYDN